MIDPKISLNICGATSKELLEKYRLIVDYKENKRHIVLFCNYSNFDIPIGYIFNQMQDLRNGTIVYIKARLKGISQEFGIKFESIPKGYKTVCNFEFIQNSIPDIVNNLPRINDWYESENILIFSRVKEK